MSVHKELAQHAANQNLKYQEFQKLDQLRELYIEEAIELCKQDKPFSTEKINEVTHKMNQINLRFVSERKYVTIEMIKEYVKK
jgi:hypothetical protein